MQPPTQHITTSLSADAVIATALRIADAEGLGALTMRRVAADLNSAPMSLYRHVEHKEALLDLMADHVLAALPELSPDERWDEGVLRFMTAMYELLLEHPAVAHLMLLQPVRGEQLQHRGESVLDCLTAGGVDDALAVEILASLIWYTLGGALYAIARGGADAPTETASRFEDVRREEFPTLHRVRRHFAADASRDHFENGLRHLIRGYENAS